MIFLPLISYIDSAGVHMPWVSTLAIDISMIGIKSFHLFFIFMSILLSGWYGYFEIATPSNPGNISTSLSIISF